MCTRSLSALPQAIVGTLLEVDPSRRLVYTGHYVGDEDTRTEHPSRVTWGIAALGTSCKLTVIHDQFAEGVTGTYAKVGGGWPLILSNLKSVLETGEPITPSDESAH